MKWLPPVLCLVLCVGAGACKKKAPPAKRAQKQVAQSSQAPARGGAPKKLEGPITLGKLHQLLPTKIDGAKRWRWNKIWGRQIHASYKLSSTRFVNITFAKVKNRAFARSQHRLRGKKLTPGVLESAGKKVGGLPVVRDYFFRSNKSEARLLLHGALSIRVSVEPAKDKDEALRLLEQLDLKALAHLARSHSRQRPRPRATGRRAP